MKGRILIWILITVFVLTPTFLYAQADGGSQMMSPPPVAQILVREGSFAVNLAGALNLGNPANENEAESLLGSAGVAPRNGWIADYPVTPDIIGELQTSVTEAAVAGRLSISRDAALTAFQNVLTGYNLPLQVNISGNRGYDENFSSNPEPEVINNYYSEEGPPVVTYYAPPADYSYLYDWVPYPFWWYDWWFPGFFVLTDFAVFTSFEGHHHHDHGRGEFVSNHFRDPKTGAVGRIDPLSRTSGSGFHSGSSSRWSSPVAQKGASAIFNHDLPSRSRFVASATYGRTTAQPAGNRHFFSPQGSQRASINSSGRVYPSSGTFRIYNRTGYYGGRTWSRQASGSYGSALTSGRSYSAPIGNAKSFNYNGTMRGSVSGGRGSFGGVHSR